MIKLKVIIFSNGGILFDRAGIIVYYYRASGRNDVKTSVTNHFQADSLSDIY